MSSFVFNSFKERYLKGEVDTNDNWTFIPVSTAFKENFETDNIRLDQYRSLSDFAEIKPGILKYKCNSQGEYYKGQVRTVNIHDPSFTIKGRGLINGSRAFYNWKKAVKVDKPQYITTENSGEFFSLYGYDLSGNDYINGYILNGGFYYIQSQSELEWFAKRSLVNNRITGVFGNDLTAQISNPIGNNEKIPFEGVLDGNYHKFDLKIKGRNSDCGLIGVMGKFGIARNFRLKGKAYTNTMECDKQITLNYIKKDGRDINCGVLVGRNYGLVENVDAFFEHFTLNGFVPSVYSVTNKSDRYRWNEKNNIVREKFDSNLENYLYLNSFCINSPGNICPYVGYFNEGKFSDGNEALAPECFSFTPDDKFYLNLGTQEGANKSFDYRIKVNSYSTANGIDYPIMGNFYTYNGTSANSATYIYYDKDSRKDLYENNKYILSHNPLYYGVDSEGEFTTRCIGPSDKKQNYSTINYNSNLIVKSYGHGVYYNTKLEPSFENARCSLRLHPMARAAYNVGTLVGANFGTIRNAKIVANVKNTSNFVGFIGGIAGKQAQGDLYNISVYMNNDLTYDLGTQPLNGDVVYYKQTPILPDKIYQEFNSIVPNFNNDDGGKKRNQFIQDFFKPWDTIEGKKVNTATNITDDVITYKLRPIFVVGGLFGRYIPTYADGFATTVRDITAIYKDNFNSTPGEKRPENAFGVLAGKVDYGITTNSFYFKSLMNCYNCRFSALSNVGEPFNYVNHQFLDGSGWSPVTVTHTAQAANPNDPPITYYSIQSGTSTKRFVGVYEIKNNVFDPVVYNVNSYEHDKTKGEMKLSDSLIYYVGDYPFDLSSHFGGIIRTHNFWNFTRDASGKDEIRNNIQVSGKQQYGDFHHLYYNDPNVDINNTNNYNNAVGHNKRNVASKIINLHDCYSNLDCYIQLYDDYINQWDLFEIPSPTSSYFTGATANKFSQDDIALLTFYWTRSHSQNNVKITNTATVSSYTVTHTFLSGVSSLTSNEAFGIYSGYFNNGLINDQCYTHVRNGTQNTFDGYTTVNYLNGAQCSPADSTNDYATSVDGISPNKLQCYNLSSSAWNSNKIYKKNILRHLNGQFVTNRTEFDIQFNDKVLGTIPTRYPASFAGEYNFNAYNSTVNNVTADEKSLDDVFAFTMPVEFKASNNVIGYTTPLTDYEKEFGVNSQITIGQYVTPHVIYQELNKVDVSSFNTSSVSSRNGFGGLLVVDSSGRNVMFLDNDNNTDLTGNVVTYPTTTISTDKYILRVQ